MQVSIYTASMPIMIRHLTALSAIIDKAIAHCAEKKINQAAIVFDRLYPDMHTFARQVQIATDQAKGCAARLSGVEIPVYSDDEKTLEDLKARVEKTIAFLKSAKEDAINKANDKEIVLKFASGERRTDGGTYLLYSALPNFYFHVTTAYDILRHRGLAIGKSDFLGPSPY